MEELGALKRDNYNLFMWIETRNLMVKIAPLHVIWLRLGLFEVLSIIIIMLNKDVMFHAHLLREWAQHGPVLCT